MIVYRPSDRIPVAIGKIKIWISPLTAGQYSNLMSMTKMQGGVEVADAAGMAIRTLKYCIKKVDGLNAQYADGSTVEFDYDSDGCISDESLDVLVSVLELPKLSLLASKIATEGIKDHKIPGVKIDLKGVISAKKK